MRDIKRRVRAVSNIRQITRAMELVASTKMRRARELLNKTRPYSQTIEDVIDDIITYIREDERYKEEGEKYKHSLMDIREVKKTCYIIISADRGLAGSYNVNVIREVQSHLNISKRDETSMIVIGQKARDYFVKRNYEMVGEFTHITENPTYNDAKKIGKLCMELYSQGLVDEVYLVYTKFLTTISYKPTTTRLLPLEPKEIKKPAEDKDKPEVAKFMLYEPSAEEILNYLIPKYIESMISSAFSFASVIILLLSASAVSVAFPIIAILSVLISFNCFSYSAFNSFASLNLVSASSIDDSMPSVLFFINFVTGLKRI